MFTMWLATPLCVNLYLSIMFHLLAVDLGLPLVLSMPEKYILCSKQIFSCPFLALPYAYKVLEVFDEALQKTQKDVYGLYTHFGEGPNTEPGLLMRQPRNAISHNREFFKNDLRI